MKVAAIDFGKVRVGVAISDELGLLAHPRAYLDGSNMKRLLAALAAFAEAEQLERFVVGLPRHLDGREGPAARRARSFARLLKQSAGIPVELVDEWLSTRQAQLQLRDQGLDVKRSRERIDSAAAAVFLQSWLDRHRASSDLQPPNDE
jgi:putative holliday junction resolvase